MFKLLAMGLAIIVLNGCAGINFYSDKDLTVRTGLRYYTTKPYLLVARVEGDTNPVKVEIVYLPDLADPQYAKPVKGFGKNIFKFTMANSILTDVNIETDQNVSDVVNAVTTAFKTFTGETVNITGPRANTGLPFFGLYEIDMKNRKLINLERASTVAFALASTSVAEGGGHPGVDVVLTTTGTALIAPISVNVVDLGTGSATQGQGAGFDYTYSTQRVIFPIGATNGATQRVTVRIADDACKESIEDIDLQLTNVVGAAVLGAQIDHRVDITDADNATC